MSTLGIIAEYNPFHNGHLYHIEKSKELTGADTVVAVMSGNFVQRGEPALADKWLRSQAAVSCGADLVLELPFVFACGNSEWFARGAVGILNGLGCMDYMSFGSESGEMDRLAEIAEVLAAEPDKFKEALRLEIKKGVSFPRARAAAVCHVLGEHYTEMMREPNNILAIEYLKQLRITESTIKPITVIRKGGDYHDKSGENAMPGASAIRRILGNPCNFNEVSGMMPEKTTEIYKKIHDHVNPKLNDFFNIIAGAIIRADREELAQIYGMGEGLENRLKQAVMKAKNTDELVEQILSKRYTATRVNRLLVQVLVGLTKADMAKIDEERLCYTRVLAANERGRALLKKISQSGELMIPLLTNINKELEGRENLEAIMKFDRRAADLYNLVYNGELYKNSDFVRKPAII